MNIIAHAFSEGGIFMYLILLAGLAIWVPIGLQIAFAKKADFSPLLWALLLGLLLLGVLGSVVGAIQGFHALAMAASDRRQMLVAQIIAIALNTTALSLIMGLPAAVGVGVAGSVARMRFGRQGPA